MGGKVRQSIATDRRSTGRGLGGTNTKQTKHQTKAKNKKISNSTLIHLRFGPTHRQTGCSFGWKISSNRVGLWRVNKNKQNKNSKNEMVLLAAICCWKFLPHNFLPLQMNPYFGWCIIKHFLSLRYAAVWLNFVPKSTLLQTHQKKAFFPFFYSPNPKDLYCRITHQTSEASFWPRFHSY